MDMIIKIKKPDVTIDRTMYSSHGRVIGYSINGVEYGKVSYRKMLNGIVIYCDVKFKKVLEI